MPVVVQTSVEGVALWWIEPKSPTLWKDAGAVLKEIHKINLNGFGALDLRDGTLEGELASWKEFILLHKPDQGFLVEEGYINNDEANQVEAAFGDILKIKVDQASFLHHDFHGSHIFSDGKRITGVIDLASAVAGDPRYDVAMAHFFLSSENRAYFNQGYGDLASDPLVSRYLLCIAARKVEYRHKKGFKERIPNAVETLKESLKNIRS